MAASLPSDADAPPQMPGGWGTISSCWKVFGLGKEPLLESTSKSRLSGTAVVTAVVVVLTVLLLLVMATAAGLVVV